MDKISELLTRGVANVIPSKELLEKQLRTGKKLNIYLGIDPTATKIHLGHAVSLRILQKLSELGHNVTFLIGDFTALVGDTSDKDSERPMLTKEKIEENFHTYKLQAEKLLDFSKINIRYNSEWLDKLNLREFLKISNIFSINDFISRELIKKRLNEGKRVGLTESFYPLLQAYDSYKLATDVQIGGTDQTFNMQSGRTLIKSLDERDSFVLSTEFLMGTDGRKMSKTWDNAIWLDDDPFVMYRKVMSITDGEIKNYFILATNLSMKEIPSDKEIENNPLEIKKQLAKIIVTELHSENEAKKAAEKFTSVVQNKEIPTDIPVKSLSEVLPHGTPSSNATASDIAMGTATAGSISEFKRLVNQGGVRIDGRAIESYKEPFKPTSEGTLFQIGKKSIKIKK